MLRRRRTPVPIRTSIIVPCTPRHAPHLRELVDALLAQTQVPDELCISISEYRGSPPVTATTLSRGRRLPFQVRIVTEATAAYAGRNRNRAADLARSNLLLYVDADDLPHPQRVEITATLFANYEVDHLLHHYDHLTAPAQRASWSRHRFDVAAAGRVAYYQVYGRDGYAHPFHNGNNVTSRALFRAVRWPEQIRRGQDVAYNRAVAATPLAPRMARLPWSLVSYRQYLSTTRHARAS